MFSESTLKFLPSSAQTSQPNLSWAEIGLSSELRGAYTHPPYTLHPPTLNSSLALFITYFCIIHDLLITCS